MNSNSLINSTHKTLSSSRKWHSLRHSHVLSKDRCLKPVWTHCLGTFTYLRPSQLSFQPFGPYHQPVPGLELCKTPSLPDWSLDTNPRRYSHSSLPTAAQHALAQIQANHAPAPDQKGERNLPLSFWTFSMFSSGVMILFLIALWVQPLEMCLHLVSLAADPASSQRLWLGFMLLAFLASGYQCSSFHLSRLFARAASWCPTGRPGPDSGPQTPSHTPVD